VVELNIPDNLEEVVVETVTKKTVTEQPDGPKTTTIHYHVVVLRDDQLDKIREIVREELRDQKMHSLKAIPRPTPEYEF